MFDFVHENKRVVQVVLALIILPFALWGVSSYRQAGGSGALATVDGEKITQQEFDNAMRRQMDQMRGMLHGSFDPAMFDKPEVRYAILDNLVNQKLLAARARTAGLTLSDEQLAQLIQGVEAFQSNGKFDRQQYEAMLRKQNLSPAMFESQVKQDIAVRQLAELYTQNGYASNTAAENIIRVEEQRRVVSVAQIALEPFLKQAKVEDAAIKDYYDNNQQEFRTPERARVEYAILSADSLAQQVAVDAEEVRKYYDEHQSEFGEPEQRHAAHILIAVPAQASEAARQAALAKAEDVLRQVQQLPGKFSELAKKYSDDPGSASKGGDLGFFGSGMMVKAFDEAAFSLKPGEISGLVQSDFGFHIIKLLAVKPAKIPPLEQVKNNIVQKLKLQKADEKFAELADKFSNTVYEQSDSLKPAAELAKVPVQQSGWLNKGQPGGVPWTDKALQAVFSDDVLNKKRNSAAIEVTPNTLLAARLLEYKPASVRPLDEVKEIIRQRLLRQQASELAVKQGQAVLEQLQHGDKTSLVWKKGQSITRAKHDGLDAELARMVVRAGAGKLPVYVGAANAQGGYAIARIDEVKEVGAIDDAKRSRYVQQLRQLTGEELLQDYLADARKHASISVDKSLDKK